LPLLLLQQMLLMPLSWVMLLSGALLSRVPLLSWVLLVPRVLIRAFLLPHLPWPPATRRVVKELLRRVSLSPSLGQHFGIAVGVYVLQALRDGHGNVGKNAVGDEPLKGRFEVVVRVVFEAVDFAGQKKKEKKYTATGSAIKMKGSEN
jgi:hypothetical protein